MSKEERITYLEVLTDIQGEEIKRIIRAIGPQYGKLIYRESGGNMPITDPMLIEELKKAFISEANNVSFNIKGDDIKPILKK